MNHNGNTFPHDCPADVYSRRKYNLQGVTPILRTILKNDSRLFSLKECTSTLESMLESMYVSFRLSRETEEEELVTYNSGRRSVFLGCNQSPGGQEYGRNASWTGH